MADKIIKRVAQAELRRLGFTRIGTSNSGSSYYERHNSDLKQPSRFSTTDLVRLSDHYHPTVFDGYEYDVSGFEDLEDILAEMRKDLATQ